MNASYDQLSGLSPKQKMLFELLIKQKQVEDAGRAQIARRSRDSNTFPLSFSQQRLWFLEQLQPSSPLYNLPSAVRLTGQLNIAALNQSLNAVVERHEILRATFHAVEGEPVQMIAPRMEINITFADLSYLQDEVREQELARLTTADYYRPFDLTRGPLIRASLMRLREDEHALMLTMHHIVSDGWSLNVLIRELATLYLSISNAKSVALPELPIQYIDFAQWQREFMSGEVLAKYLSYWKPQLEGSEMALELSAKRPSPPQASASGAHHSFGLSKALSDELKQLSQQEEATTFMLYLAAFATLLRRYTGQESINFGSSIANRNRAETESLIGMFVNTLVLRADLSGDPTFKEMLRRVRDVTLGGYEHQDLPFERLVEEMNPERNINLTPLFQVGFTTNYEKQNSLEIPSITLPGLTVAPQGVFRGTAKLDLSLDMTDTEQEVFGLFAYRTDLFDAGTITRMAIHFQNLLESIAANPEQRISQLQIMSAEERNKILVEWNRTETQYPQGLCFHDLIHLQALMHPHRVALKSAHHELTFHQLDTQANHLAGRLIRLGVGPDDRVAIFIERSVEMIICMLAVAKAGAAYLPVDLQYPVARISYMLEESRAKAVLTRQGLERRLPGSDAQVVRVDSLWEFLADESEQPSVRVDERNLAYVIYTSGSTGKPKGVMVEHKGLMNYLMYAVESYGVKEAEASVMHTSLGFDLTVTSVLVPLVAGKRVEIVGEEEGIAGLVEWLKKAEGKVIVKLTPAHLEVINEQMREAEAGAAEKVMVVGGEALSRVSVERLKQKQGKWRVINEYGPTETVVGSSTYEVSEAQQGEGERKVAIGRPISNARMYVLDERMEVVGVGVKGEICIAGAGVSRGYMGRGELTAERYVSDPYSEKAGERMYRTGDEGRYREDGEIEYIGRRDEQVKVRGYRVEVGEIEEVIKGIEGVREAVVMVREEQEGDKRIVGYVVVKKESEVRQERLREEVGAQLPEYMIPSHFVFLDELPLTRNGKVDRRALPPPDTTRNELAGAYAPPGTLLEAELVEMWRELLRLDDVGIHDNFFWLGGHSLLLTQLASRILKSFYVELPLRILFNTPTIAEMAAAIETALLEQVDATELADMVEEMRQL